jgi:hypothetical protein
MPPALIGIAHLAISLCTNFVRYVLDHSVDHVSIKLNQLNPAQFTRLPQFVFEIFARGFYRFGERRRVLTSCRQAWERR